MSGRAVSEMMWWSLGCLSAQLKQKERKTNGKAWPSSDPRARAASLTTTTRGVTAMGAERTVLLQRCLSVRFEERERSRETARRREGARCFCRRELAELLSEAETVVPERFERLLRARLDSPNLQRAI